MRKCRSKSRKLIVRSYYENDLNKEKSVGGCSTLQALLYPNTILN